MSKNQPVNKSVHFRRCHICGTLTNNDSGKVEKCSSCGKHLAPFFYFDDCETPTVTENRLRPSTSQKEYQPITGLTVHWESS